MKSAGASANFETVGNTLTVRGEIAFEDEEAFAEQLEVLFSVEADVHTVDLSKVSFMGSSCVRLVAAAIVRVGQGAPAVRVVAAKKILRLFELAGLNALGVLELVEAS